MWILLLLFFIPIGISIWSESTKARKTIALNNAFKKSGDKAISRLDTAISQIQGTTEMIQKMLL